MATRKSKFEWYPEAEAIGLKDWKEENDDNSITRKRPYNHSHEIVFNIFVRWRGSHGEHALHMLLKSKLQRFRSHTFVMLGLMIDMHNAYQLCLTRVMPNSVNME